jgi:hypothetical protein
MSMEKTGYAECRCFSCIFRLIQRRFRQELYDKVENLPQDIPSQLALLEFANRGMFSCNQQRIWISVNVPFEFY